MRKFNNVLVTGGAGFIGSNFIRYLLAREDFTGRVVNLDRLTYAGNLRNLEGYESIFKDRYFFVRADVCSAEGVRSVFADYDIDTVVHFAAESHVDRSIYGPAEFIKTNINGTFSLLEAARECWKNRDGVLFHHVSTDEVYGSLGSEGFFTEESPYDPRSPYSASKAASDHIVRSYFHTYGLPVTVSNCSNNYGPYQFPEKLIPLMILNMLDGKALPVYGKGENVRDWLYVEDHCSGIYLILKKGKTGETYNIGGENEWKNIDIVNYLCEALAREKNLESGDYRKLITFVKDRPGHDFRYAIDCSRIKRELGWSQSHTFEKGINRTVQWYLENLSWTEEVKTGAYVEWMKLNYSL